MAKDPIHPLFKVALAKMHANYRHVHPIHLDGPQPLIPRRHQVGLAGWCAEQLLPLITGYPTRGAVESCLFLIRRIADAGLEEGETNAAVAELARATAYNAPADPTSVVGLAAAAAGHVLRKKPRNIPRIVRVAVIRTMMILDRPKTEGLPTSKAFLIAFDKEMLHAEFTSVVRRYAASAAARLQAVVYRGGDDHGGGAVWLVHLDTTYGLLARLGPRLKWFEGSRDEVLATVPSAHFEAAIDAAFLYAPKA